ncbi:hydantoinase/oxoprolinase family protein [Ignicoccus islandicus]|uniref:hydantoinase/oxoprolinase family protein n=1 Tax=Ignicoccus islandicus TaxID=54259 RepID=UPI001F2AE027|nr:hydantoinase/oxoprolinase family protein [Ignicoccus islandicus]
MAVDVGGTFTDLYAVSRKGESARVKVLSTPQSPEIGVLNAIDEFLERGVRPQEVDLVIHATTIATNAFLGQKHLKLAEVSLVTTKGMEDIIEIQRQKRPNLYDFTGKKPKPLVPPELRFGVKERVNFKGEVIEPLDVSELLRIAPNLRGIVAVCFLHSYANPVNEIKAKEILERLGFDVVASHESTMERREYERFSTTIVNAALKPLVSSYLLRLVEALKSKGIEAPLFVVASSGGLVTIEEAMSRPAQLIESGPAGGAVGAAYYAKKLGVKEALAFDMGGTTAKAAVVINGEPVLTREYEVGGEVHAGRLVKGSGYPVRYPFIDLAEVSAGGGTIAWSENGILRVGPISAGANPGPACYGLGGEEPTVTDANLVLGRLPERLPSGLKLRKDLALKAFEKLSKELGSDPIEVAEAVIEAITEEMGRAVRIVTIERGIDPSELILIAYGGMGPLHAAELAEQFGIKEILVPMGAGVFTAFGMLNSDVKYSITRSVVKEVTEDLEPYFLELEAAVRRRMELSGMSVDRFERVADVRYSTQGWTLEVKADKPYSPEKLARRFEELHERRYGFKLDVPIVVENIGVTAIHYVNKVGLKGFDKEPLEIGKTEAWFMGRGFEEATVYERFGKGEVRGPGIIMDYDTTVLVPSGWIAKALEDGTLMLRRA